MYRIHKRKKLMKIKSKPIKINNAMCVDIETTNTHTYQLSNGVVVHNSSSLLLNTASGIHPRWSPRYFRRIQANRLDPVYQAFQEKNPHACEESVWSTNNTDDVITFCVESPEGAITNDDTTALEMLRIVKLVQENWVLPGTALPESSPGLYHNVSNTIRVKPDEWDDVANYVYEHRKFFTGISMLPENTNAYQQAPHQQINSGDDELAWTNLTEGYQNVDYTKMSEDDDNTKLKEIIACAGGACELN